MKLDLNINLKKYIASKLSLNEFVLLQCIYNKDYKEAALIQGIENINLSKLETELWIKITGLGIEDIFPRQKMLDLFQTKDEQEVDLWIEQWLELFPKGVKSGGYYVKSNKEDCLKKMIKFLKIRKYTKKQIFEATQNYIDRKAKENYSYMMKAEYFIEKDGVSTLATEIDNLGEEEDADWTRNPL